MTLSHFKDLLSFMDELQIQLPDGSAVPAHFHVTELGKTSKHFVDCGGTERLEQRATFQLWVATDTDHRLKAEKLIRIIDMAAPLFQGLDPEVEVEYQQETIGRFGLALQGDRFVLTPTQTACLALENCGLPAEKPKLAMAELYKSGSCTPGSGCC